MSPPTRFLPLVALGALYALGCDDDTTSPGSGGAPGTTTTTASSSISAASGSSSTGQAEPFTGDAPTCVVTDDPAAPAACCPAQSLRALPANASSVLDLSDPRTITEGTCSTFSGVGLEAVLLSQSPADYPLKIVLPALAGADPACEETCPIDVGMPPHTAFGIAIATGSVETGYLIGGNTGRVLAISVPEPWFFVSGGCGEACPWPCIEGYQEYGVPRSCITIAHGDFGFATSDPNAPSVEAVVELIDLGGDKAFELAPGSCCLYGD